MDDNLEKLYARLSLGGKETTPLSTDGIISDQINPTLSLVGKLMAPRVISFDQISSLFRRLWSPKSTLSCKPLHDNVILFTFGNISDKKRVLLGMSWLFDKYLLLLKDATEDMISSNIEFSTCPFWIQLHGLPLGLFTKSFAERAGNYIGTYLDVHTDSMDSVVGKFLRIKVDIDIHKPICRIIQLDKKFKNSTVYLKYERLPDFCFHCGIIGHVLKDCDDYVTKHGTDESQLQFGNWLRAANITNPFASNRPSSSTNNPDIPKNAPHDKPISRSMPPPTSPSTIICANISAPLLHLFYGRSKRLAALLWKKNVTVSLRGYNDRFIDVDVTFDSSHFRLTGVYGQPNVSLRPEFWRNFQRLYTPSNTPWICVGDFNEVLKQSEFSGVRPRAQWQINLFRDAIATCNLTDMGYCGRKFTWQRLYVYPHTQRGRLDRCLCNPSFLRLFPRHKIYKAGKIHGIRVTKSAPSISHLFFSRMTLYFLGMLR
ncbi:hypothetical protein DH2020_021035 [Rehmannia glutinosa]|uniref:CCHC-type domain-containing protein n=1 Tax=Rehmannia glutinosa TaxID=99300 RepID=A0ABR0WAP5_REHGL